MDVLHASLFASLSSNKGRAIQHTYMSKPSGSIMVLEDKHDAFYEAYTETIRAGIVLRLTETKVWLGPLWLTWTSGFQVM